MKLLQLGALCLVVMGGSGCASLTTSNDTMVRVETVAADGTEVRDADCSLNRGGAALSFKSPGSVAVPKSSSDVHIECKKSGQPDGKGVLTSRVGAMTFGNILIGGGVGAIVDQATGKAYNYPEWIRIVMGKVLGFDRQNHVDGSITPGNEINAAATTTNTSTTSSVPAAAPTTPAATPAKTQ